MSASQTATTIHRTPGPIAILAAAAFALGTLTGLGVQGALDRASAATAGGPSFQGVAGNNMSDAANAAVHPAPTRIVRFQGVAANNMSDAANAAVHGPRYFQGVAANNMSDAARRAVYADAR